MVQVSNSTSECRFQKLNTLRLEQNKITGQLPLQWGSPDSFPSLINLVLGNNNISGAALLCCLFHIATC